MDYIPHTDQERQKMLADIGVQTIEDLFSDIPPAIRYPDLHLPDGLSEPEVMQELRGIAEKNCTATSFPTFLGAGAYHHWVPSVVDNIISRGEFSTAYTPYQAEVSQGTLQAIFEYQSLICDLTDMDVANASHYDGATSTAEAVIQAYNVFRKKRRRVLIAPTVHPHYTATVLTYTQGMDLEVSGHEDPSQTLDQLISQVDKETACIILQSPNFLGEIEPLEAAITAIRNQDKAALIVVIANPISLGLFKAPGTYGADIVVGDGQPLGLGLNFGGPYLGFYATRSKYVRQMAGRLVGKALDIEGRQAYVMTLTTREQHIRRDRATSNICSNQGLMALAATVYLSVLGKNGLRKLAELNYHKAHYAAREIHKLPGYRVSMRKPFFNEFVVTCPRQVSEINAKLNSGETGATIIGGYDLGEWRSSWNHQMLVAVTEMNTRADMDALVAGLAAISPTEEM
ncbi:MAG: aminomethyl-transferring glycine dehydrogenase subunit GcvPA [Anaerolineae bacterium]|nr:aminomethyl-transferring glycine dehydrogenase subunit GcvPA [Anaerolineae bacterium]